MYTNVNFDTINISYILASKMSPMSTYY